MTIQPELVMERAESPKMLAATASTPKTILLHVQDDTSLDRRIEAGLALARATSAHLSCIHVTPIQAYVAFDSFGGVFVMKDVIQKIDERAGMLQAKVEKKLRSEDVRWDYAQLTGDVAASIVTRAALADLVVVGRDPHRDDFAAPATGTLGDLLYRSRSPLFLLGDAAGAFDPCGLAVIAWDGSYEAANAVRGALGLLRMASDVRVVSFAEEKSELFPSTTVLEYLSRHGIEAVLDERPVHPDGIDAGIVEYASVFSASYVVMGGYSHSRAGEFLFGGVTRALLKACPVSLVIAH